LNSLLLAEVMADRGRTLGELVQELTDEFGPHFYGRVDLEISKDVAQRIVRLVGRREIKRIAGLKVTSVDDLDGVKMRFGNTGWLLVRASGTENVLRLYAEAPSPEQVKALLTEIEAFSRRQM
jgi:phosphomannomutase